MALIKNVVKPEAKARLAVAIKEGQLRKLHAYRVLLETEHGYRPTLPETIELFLAHIFEDKDFVKWYKPEDEAQAARIDAAIKTDAKAKAADDTTE